MPRIVFAGLAVSLILGPAAVAHSAGDGPDAPPARTSVQHFQLSPRLCLGLLGNRADGCSMTSVLTTSNGPSEVVGNPFDGAAVTASSSRCNADHPYRECRINFRHARDYKWNICFGMTNGCTDHVSPAWFKVRQLGRYWRGETCMYSVALPVPHTCKPRFAWTKAHHWRRRSFRPGDRVGWHRCQKVSSSDFHNSIDSCWLDHRRDPADVGSRYGPDLWWADANRHGMRWEACNTSTHQCRSYGSWLQLKPSGAVIRRGDWSGN